MSLLRALESNSELYSTIYEDVTLKFRLLKIKEYNYFNKILTGGHIPPFLIFEEIFNLCSFDPVEFFPKELPMGYFISTGHLIYYLSGGKETKNFLLEIAQTRTEHPPDSIFEHMKSIIFTAFPSLCLKDIDEMTEKEFVRNFVTAENKLIKTMQGYTPLDLKKIYEEIYESKTEEVEKKSEVVHNIKNMEQELGYWEVQEAEAKFIEEEKARLTREHLAKLDQRKG